MLRDCCEAHARYDEIASLVEETTTRSEGIARMVDSSVSVTRLDERIREIKEAYDRLSICYFLAERLFPCDMGGRVEKPELSTTGPYHELTNLRSDPGDTVVTGDDN